MAAVTIYHNPRCSKSRQTLALLEARGIKPHVIEYLKDPPSAATVRSLAKMLGLRPADLIRKKEALFKELNLAAVQDDEQLIKAMVKHPILIERPIVVCAKQARVGRPLEQVLEII